MSGGLGFTSTGKRNNQSNRQMLRDIRSKHFKSASKPPNQKKSLEYLFVENESEPSEAHKHYLLMQKVKHYAMIDVILSIFGGVIWYVFSHI